MLDDPRMTNSTFIEGYSSDGSLHYAPYKNDPRGEPRPWMGNRSNGNTNDLCSGYYGYECGREDLDYEAQPWRSQNNRS
jgi:hypothetical protein